MADDSPHMLPFTMDELDLEATIRSYYTADPDKVPAMVAGPWICALKLPTTGHTWLLPDISGNGMSWGIRLDELAQIEPAWMSGTLTLTYPNGSRAAAARRVRLFIGDDPWGVDTYFPAYDGDFTFAVNIRRAPSPRDAGQPDPDRCIRPVPVPAQGSAAA